MKKYVVVLAVVVLFIFAFVVSVFSDDIVWEDIGRGNFNLKSVLVDTVKPQIIYIGSNNGVFKTQDSGENWRNILSIRGQNRTVNFLLFGPEDNNSLYAATGGGLFHSPNQGRNWNRIFHGKNYLENECAALAILSDTIYLGTKAGLFVSKDKGRNWHKETGRLGNSNILAIACNLKEPNNPEPSNFLKGSLVSRSNASQNDNIRDIYVACADGVFKSDNRGESWERIFVANTQEDGSEVEEKIDDIDEEVRFSEIRYISIDYSNTNRLYLTTSRGIYISQNKGKTWEHFPIYGLLSQDTRFLLISKNSNLYAIARSGVFEYRTERWQELSFNLAAGEIRFLALDYQNNLYAASDKGLFKANTAYSNNIRDNNIISVYSQKEPKINEIQQAAIKYAEVQPEKIKHWRQQAAKKAWLPQVSTGINRNVTDLWHWEAGSTTKLGDDILVKGKDAIAWDVTLAWNLGELIWNDDQTSIDVRSRLMVQLRQDVLDEVTKLYFERTRVKMELENLGIEDRKKRFEKELKLQELTAQLDGLTGGYFSTQIKEKL